MCEVTLRDSKQMKDSLERLKLGYLIELHLQDGGLINDMVSFKHCRPTPEWSDVAHMVIRICNKA